jgi:hypothetical protein
LFYWNEESRAEHGFRPASLEILAEARRLGLGADDFGLNSFEVNEILYHPKTVIKSLMGKMSIAVGNLMKEL